MALPIRPLPTSSVEVNGAEVSFRSLSRAEALALQDYKGREDEAEVFILVKATGCSEDEAQAFRSESLTRDAGLLIDAILELSGLTGDGSADPKPDTSAPSSKEPSTATSST